MPVHIASIAPMLPRLYSSHSRLYPSVKIIDTNWYLNSGASAHMTNNIGNLQHAFPYNIPVKVLDGNSQSISIDALGRFVLHTSCILLHMSFVYYIPVVSQNLLSIKELFKDNDCVICFDAKSFTMMGKVTGRDPLRSESTFSLYLQHVVKNFFTQLICLFHSPQLVDGNNNLVTYILVPSIISHICKFMTVLVSSLKTSNCMSCMADTSHRLPFPSGHSWVSFPLVLLPDV